MKEKLRKKLIQTRNDFLELDDYEEYEFFGLVVLLTPKEEKVFIELRPVAFKDVDKYKEEAINLFADEEIIGELNQDREEFEELVKYALKRYQDQFSFGSSFVLDALYGEGMNIEKFLYIINDIHEINQPQLYIDIGFIITETIF